MFIIFIANVRGMDVRVKHDSYIVSNRGVSLYTFLIGSAKADRSALL